MRVHRSAARRRRIARVGLPLLAVFALLVAAVTGVGSGEGTGGPRGGEGGGAGEAKDGQQSQRHPQRRAPVNVERFVVGRGARAAVVVRPEGLSGPQPTIVFLHGWGQVSTRDYGPWLKHFVQRGNTVVFPRYQVDESSPPGQVLGNALAGLRSALSRIEVKQGTLVAAGHSAGAAMAVDYATLAKDEGLPQPAAVFAAYPGRAIMGYPGGIPAGDEGKIPSGVRLVALAGAADTVVGEGPARAIVENAVNVPPDRRRLIRVTASAVADHSGPERSGRAARRAFWRPLDRLIARARAGS